MQENCDMFIFSKRKTTIRLFCSDIVFFESEGHYVLIHMKNNEIYKMRGTMKDILENTDRKMFVQVHRAFVVNLSYVHKVEKDKIYLQFGLGEVPMSRMYKLHGKEILD